MPARILTVIMDAALRERVCQLVQSQGWILTDQEATGDWLSQVEREEFDLALVDRGALQCVDCRSVDSPRQAPSRAGLIALTEDAGAEERVALLAAGCMAVLQTELPDHQLASALTMLIAKHRMESETVEREFRIRDRPAGLGAFVSRSPTMQKFLSTAKRLCNSDSTVLILGETGVGKERLARAIHSESHRRDGPFVVLNCAAVPDSLLESELFGHEKGSFTGAARAHRGHFELAHGGTILLDEIGEVPAHMQVKLLRVLQERAIQRVGGEKSIAVNVRVMAATNRDIPVDVEEKRFRSDLYYRLSVVTLSMPPLRERKEDIRALVDLLFEEARAQFATTACRISREAMDLLERHTWPGNVRELTNAIERAVLLAEGAEVTAGDLPEAIGARPTAPGVSPPTVRSVPQVAAFDEAWLCRPLGESRRAWNSTFERAYLHNLLRATGGHVGVAATRAGIDPRSLYTKMQRHGLRKEDFRLPISEPNPQKPDEGSGRQFARG